MTLGIPAVVRDLVDEAGGSVDEHGGLVRISFGDTSLRVHEDASGYVVDAVERGVVEGVDLETTSRAALERFLVVSAGVSWRSRQRLGTLHPPSRTRAASGTSLQADGPTWVLTWEERGRPERAVFWSQWDARAVAQALTVDLEVVVAAVRRADGGPLYVVA